MIKTVGELRKELEKYPDDMMLTVADWEDQWRYIESVAHPADVDPDEGIEIDTSMLMVFTADYIKTVNEEMYWEILAAEEMQKQKEAQENDN